MSRKVLFLSLFLGLVLASGSSSPAAASGAGSTPGSGPRDPTAGRSIGKYQAIILSESPYVRAMAGAGVSNGYYQAFQKLAVFASSVYEDMNATMFSVTMGSEGLMYTIVFLSLVLIAGKMVVNQSSIKEETVQLMGRVTLCAILLGQGHVLLNGIDAIVVELSDRLMAASVGAGTQLPGQITTSLLSAYDPNQMTRKFIQDAWSGVERIEAVESMNNAQPGTEDSEYTGAMANEAMRYAANAVEEKAGTLQQGSGGSGLSDAMSGSQLSDLVNLGAIRAAGDAYINARQSGNLSDWQAGNPDPSILTSREGQAVIAARVMEALEPAVQRKAAVTGIPADRIRSELSQTVNAAAQRVNAQEILRSVATSVRGNERRQNEIRSGRDPGEINDPLSQYFQNVGDRATASLPGSPNAITAPLSRHSADIQEVYRSSSGSLLRANNISPSLWSSLMQQESNGNERIRNGASGATGLGQLMPATANSGEFASARSAAVQAQLAREGQPGYSGPRLSATARAGRGLDVSDLQIPLVNLHLSAAVLGQYSQQFGGNPILGMAAYNAGPGRIRSKMRMAQRYGVPLASILPTETRNYVPSILGHLENVDPQQAARLQAFAGQNYGFASTAPGAIQRAAEGVADLIAETLAGPLVKMAVIVVVLIGSPLFFIPFILKIFQAAMIALLVGLFPVVVFASVLPQFKDSVMKFFSSYMSVALMDVGAIVVTIVGLTMMNQMHEAVLAAVQDYPPNLHMIMLAIQTTVATAAVLVLLSIANLLMFPIMYSILQSGGGALGGMASFGLGMGALSTAGLGVSAIRRK